MQMIDVIKRLAELDDANGGIKESTKMVQDAKVAVITESAIGEFGSPMGMTMTPPMGMASTPASFSINASAASGDEVANMLTQIMTLAGVKSHGDQPMHEPSGHDAQLTGEPPMGGKAGIRSALDAIDQVEDEEAELGGMSDIGSDEIADMDGMGAEMGTAGPAGGDVGTMADQVQDMAQQLAGKDKEDLGLESLRQFDNSPQEKTRSTDPLNDFANVLNKIRSFEYTPPNSGSNPITAEATANAETAVQETVQKESLASITTDLMKAYETYKSQ
jgi:hypothetical protein